MAISQPLVDAAHPTRVGSANRTACYYSNTSYMAQGALIDVDSLVFRWPSASLPCLAIDSLRIEAGERIFLFGPSGSGKSTLLALLAGVLTAQEGKVRVLGTELSSLRRRDRFRVDHIGFIFQQFNLVPYLSVLHNVSCPAASRRSARNAQSKLMVRPSTPRNICWMRWGSLADLRKRKATDLSVGQQQRVAAARRLKTNEQWQAREDFGAQTIRDSDRPREGAEAPDPGFTRQTKGGWRCKVRGSAPGRRRRRRGPGAGDPWGLRSDGQVTHPCGVAQRTSSTKHDPAVRAVAAPARYLHVSTRFLSDRARAPDARGAVPAQPAAG